MDEECPICDIVKKSVNIIKIFTEGNMERQVMNRIEISTKDYVRQCKTM